MASVFDLAASSLVEDLKAAAYNRGDQDYLNELGRAERSAAEGQAPPNLGAALNDFELDRRQARVEAASGVRYSDTAAPDYVDPTPVHAAPIPDEAQIDWSDPRIQQLAGIYFSAPDPDEPAHPTELGYADMDQLTAAHAIASGTATQHQHMVHLSDPANAAKFEAELVAQGYDLDQLKRLAEAHDWDWGKALDALGDIGPAAPGIDGALDNTLAEARHVRGTA